jgi:hypothetical protein
MLRSIGGVLSVPEGQTVDNFNSPEFVLSSILSISWVSQVTVISSPEQKYIGWKSKDLTFGSGPKGNGRVSKVHPLNKTNRDIKLKRKMFPKKAKQNDLLAFQNSSCPFIETSLPILGLYFMCLLLIYCAIIWF